MKNKIVLELPLPTITQKGKKHNLSMNVYRNAYYRDLNKAKKEYSEIVQLKLLQYRRKHFEKISVHFTLFNKNKRRRDLSNFCAVVDKFLLDTMVKMKMIKDDDCDTVPKITYEFGGVLEDKIIATIKGE